MSDKYNPYIFQNSNLWADYDQSGAIKKKLPIIFDHIPEDVVSIIDIGCGNGEITNQFPQKYTVLGVDNSKEALNYVQKEKLNCSANNIPVKDHSYDMVFSSELIEHLPKKVLYETINEFKRIAKKYIFISIPNNEQLKNYLIKCPLCNKTFHAYGHLNSFNMQILQNLLGNNFHLTWTSTAGKTVKEFNPILLTLKHALAKKYFAPSEYTICPHCLNKDFPVHKGNIRSKLINGLNLLLPRKTKKYWLFALFERI